MDVITIGEQQGALVLLPNQRFYAENKNAIYL